MTTLINNSPKTHARLTGLLYVIIAIVGGFSMGYLPTLIAAPGDAAATAANVIANKGLFQFGIFADMATFLLEVVTLSLLFMLFKPVNPTLALVATLARLSMAIVIAINVLFDFGILILVSEASFLTAFSTEQLNALTLLFVELELYGVSIWQMFFTAHLLALGYLVIKSGFVPKILGVMMMIGAFGYVSDSIGKVLSLDAYSSSMVTIVLLTIVALAEISFALWLLIKGVDDAKWKSVANKSAE